MECLGVKPGAHDGRRRRIHWAMAAPLLLLRYPMILCLAIFDSDEWMLFGESFQRSM